MRFRPAHAALILVALALAIAGFAALLTVATGASDDHSSPVVSWAEPDNPGLNIADYDNPGLNIEGYDIADYDLRYRIGGSSDEVTVAVRRTDTGAAGAVEDDGTGQAAILTHVAPGGGYNDPIGGTARVSAQAAEVEIWSAELTVGKHSSSNIYGYSRQNSYGSLSSTSFNPGGQAYTFTYLFVSETTLSLGFSPDMPFKSALTLIVDGESFPAIAGDSPSFGLLTWFDPGLTWAVGDAVTVSLKATPPGAPTSFSSAADPGIVTLSWANPSDTTITKYRNCSELVRRIGQKWLEKHIAPVFRLC